MLLSYINDSLEPDGFMIQYLVNFLFALKLSLREFFVEIFFLIVLKYVLGIHPFRECFKIESMIIVWKM